MATKGSLVGNQSLQPKRPVRYVATKKTVKSGKRKKKKPEWDSTVNDLNVHKATKEEQIRRHELHKSKNAGRMHLGRQQDQTTDLINQTPDTTERRKLAIVQEVLYGHDKLQDVLSESDRAMSVVKDLFGDDPKTFMGFPNITAAPSLNGKENRYVVGPVPELPETPTHLSLLSDSVMRTPALNEMSDEDKADQSPGTPSDLATKHSSSSFQPRLDLQRFQQFVAQEQGKDVENQSQHPTNERGSYFLSHQVPGKDHILAARGRGHESMALCGGDPVSLHGRGIDHVTQHGDIYEEPTNPQDNPSVDTTAPFVRLQAAGTLPGETKAIISEPKAYPVRRLEQVAAANHIVSQANHASESSSFLSQKSTEIVAGGPGFMVPVTSEEKTGASAVLLTAMPSSRTVTTDQQGSNKTKNIKATVKPKLNSSSSGLRSLEDLKKMVQELENEIAEYEIASGRQQSKPSAAVPQSFSGYTASLITAVTKLMNYLKESEIQRKAELIMREEVLQGFEEQRVLVDALTNDLLHTQEQNRALQHDLDQYKKNTDEQLHYLKRELFAVLRSHEYNALSSSINNLYSLNAVNLENGVFNDLRQDHHDLEYLPGGAALQAEHVASKNGRERDSTTAASFIPLATCSGQGIHLQPSMQTTDAASHAQVTQATAAPVYSYGDKTAMPNDVSHLRTTLQQGAQAYTRSIDHSHPMMHDIGIGANSTDNGVQSFDGTHPKLSSNLHNISADPNGNVLMGSNIVVYPPFQGPYTAQGENKTASQLSKDGNSAGVSSSAPVCTQQAGSRDEYSAPTTSVSSQLSNEERSQAGALSQPSLSTLVTEKQPKLPTGRNWITSTDLSLTDKSSLQSSTAGLLVGRSELFPCNVTAGHPITYTTPATYNPQHHIPGQLVGSSHFQSRDQPYWPALEPLKPTSSVSQDIQTATQSRLTNISWITPPGASVQASQLVTQKVSSNALQQRQPQLSGIPGPASNSGRFVPVSNTKTSRLPPGHLVRERLQKLANRQRTFAANPSDKNVGSASVLTQNKENNNGVQQLRPTSPHVHFKDPPVTGDKKQSPPVSPIPFRNTTITSSRAPPDKRVVVNLPNAWSDISSTFSV